MEELLLSLAWKSSEALLALVALLTAGLVASKLARQAWARYAERRAERYKPAILRAIAGEPGALDVPFFGAGARPGDRRIVRDAMLAWAGKVQGFGFRRLCELFAHAGLADRERRRLRAARWWARATAARRLGLMRCAGADEDLVAALRDPSLDVRLQAAWALGRLGRVDRLEPILSSLAGDSRLAAQRVTSVILELGPRTAPVLEGLLGASEARVRALAASVLGRLGEPGALPRLAALLSDPDGRVRERVCEALGRLGADGAEKALAERLGDPDASVRAAAAAALGAARVEAAIPGLRAALRDTDWSVRSSAGEALAKLGDAGAAALRASRVDDDRFARDMAAQWLDELMAGAAR